MCYEKNVKDFNSQLEIILSVNHLICDVFRTINQNPKILKKKQQILTFNNWNEQMFDIFFLQQDIEPQTSPADTSLCMNVTSVVKRSERRVDWSPFIRNAADLIPAY